MEYNVTQALHPEAQPVLIDGRWWLPIAVYPSRQRIILVDAYAPARILTDREFSKVLAAQGEVAS